jgi:protein-tyrosine phosphatase
MKTLSKVLGIILFFTLLIGAKVPTKPPLIDADNNFELPKKFRITKGLPNLNLVGSAQFSEQNLNYIILHNLKPKYIFDLREESHGFLNGIAISWYEKNNWGNLHRTEQQINKIQNQLLASVKYLKKVSVYKTKPDKDLIEIPPMSIFSERALAYKHNITYAHIPVSDHRRPNDEQVDYFIKIVRQIPKEEPLYFHCRGGKGRTTTFMAMVDMMRNGKNTPFEEIIRRQHELGGSNLLETTSEQFTYYAKERLQFLKQFYIYCQQNKDNYKTSWLQTKNQKSTS